MATKVSTKNRKSSKTKVRVFEVTFTVEVEASRLAEDPSVAADQVTDIIEKVWDAGEHAVRMVDKQEVYDSYTFVAEHVEDKEVDDG